MGITSLLNRMIYIPGCPSTQENDHLVTRPLSVEQIHDDQEIPNVKALGRRIKSRVDNAEIFLQMGGKILGEFWKKREWKCS